MKVAVQLRLINQSNAVSLLRCIGEAAFFFFKIVFDIGLVIDDTHYSKGSPSGDPKRKNKMNTATWNTAGVTLTYEADYDWPTPHHKTIIWNKCLPSRADYYCAVDGKTFALVSVTRDSTCIANTEDALKSAGARNVYVINALKTRSESAWKRWSSKWAKKTFDNRSVIAYIQHS